METKADTAGKNEALHCLLFSVRRSVRYHNRRRLFFDRVCKWSDALTAIAGSGTVVTLVSQQPPAIAVSLAAVTAGLAAVNLVFDTKSQARRHHDLARQFIEIEKILVRPDVSQEDLTRATEQRLTIEAEEPPVLRVLDLICHNELAKAMGYGKDASYDIKPWRACFAQLFDLFPGSIDKMKKC